LILTGMLSLHRPLKAQETASASCRGSNENSFNRIPRANAVSQATRSVAFPMNGRAPSATGVVNSER